MSEKNNIFSDEELEQFSKGCMTLAMEALDKGDIEEVRKWCKKQEETQDILHDLFVNWVTDLMSHIHRTWGEEAAVDAIHKTSKKFAIPFANERVRLLKESGVRGWTEFMVDVFRQHAMYPGFTVDEDDEKIIMTMNPCGSGGKMVWDGAYDGPDGYCRLKNAGNHTWGENDMPIYCAHCPVVHEIFPVEELGQGAQLWIHASPFPKKPGDKCVLYIYKDSKDIPAEYYDRIGMTKKTV